MSDTTEAFARVKIDALAQGRRLQPDQRFERPVRARVSRRHAGRLRTLRPAGLADGGAGGQEALSTEVSRGQCKLLGEMATETGKTRTATAFIKRILDQLLAALRQASISSTQSPALIPVGRAVMRAAKADSRIRLRLRTNATRLTLLTLEARTREPEVFASSAVAPTASEPASRRSRADDGFDRGPRYPNT